jgi:enoyl-CoA hydratase/carnithine racemase
MNTGIAGNCQVGREGRVLEIAIDRPEQRNALNYETVAELIGHLRAADADDEIGVVLLYGNGPCFCAGGDLSEFERNRGQSATEYHESGAAWAELMTIIPSLDVPVVVAAHRYALAGGLGLVAAGDVVFAAEGTQMALTEVRIGLFPAIVFATVANAAGARAARELALSGRRIDATEAQRLGLVHRVVPADQLLEQARAAAEEMAGFGSTVLRLGKELMRNAAALPLAQGTAYGKAMRGAFMETEDFRAGVARFTSKAGRA